MVKSLLNYYVYTKSYFQFILKLKNLVKFYFSHAMSHLYLEFNLKYSNNVAIIQYYIALILQEKSILINIKKKNSFVKLVLFRNHPFNRIPYNGLFWREKYYFCYATCLIRIKRLKQYLGVIMIY